MNSPEALWKELASRYTTDSDLVDDLWAEIGEAYSAPDRHYHNLVHIGHMLGDALHYRNRLANSDIVLFSIFYHDFVYDVQRQDNERKSAEAATIRLTRLGVPSSDVLRCSSQILATRHHMATDNSDTNYLLDFDLAILGESPERYAEYARNVRAEYSIYPDHLYNEGRKNVLQQFLQKERIFATEEFHTSHELQARTNIRRELQER